METAKFTKHCEACNYTTNRPSDWIKHVKCKKHLKGGVTSVHNCSDCDYSTKFKWLYDHHQITQHSTLEERKQQKYYCDICDYVFHNDTQLKKHLDGKHHKTKMIAANI